MDDACPTVDDRTVDRIRRALAARGVGFAAEGGSATFDVDGRAVTRRASWLPATSTANAAARTLRTGGGGDAVYLADRITPAVARRIRQAGGWYADTAGNVYVRAPGVLLDVSGQTPAATAGRASPPTASRNLMSAGRAQVVLALLTWPELLTESLRELGRAAGVSTAAAHTTVRLLVEDGYLTPSRLLVRRDDLIDLWAGSYPLGLARATERGRYCGEADPTAWQSLGHRVSVSGEAATSDLSGPDLVLYVPELDPRAVIAARWRRPEPGEHANVIVRETFWSDPTAPQDGPGIDHAPPLLVYGDLLASNDPRQREVAATVRGDL